MLLWMALAGCDSGPEYRLRTEQEVAAIREGVERVLAQADTMDRALHDAAWAAEEGLQLTDTPCPIGADDIIGTDPSPVRQKINLLTATLPLLEREYKETGRYQMQALKVSYDLDDKLKQEIMGDYDSLARNLEGFEFESPDHTLLLVITEMVSPKSKAKGSFDAGVLVGTAWLWRESDDTVICGARFGAMSSEEVTTTWDRGSDRQLKQMLTGASLYADLTENAARSALAGMQTAAPK